MASADVAHADEPAGARRRLRPEADPDPAELGERRRTGLAGVGLALGAFLLGLVLAGVLGVAWAAAAGVPAGEASDDLGVAAATSTGLWLGFLGVPLLVARRQGGPRRALALRLRPVDLAVGLVVGLACSLATSAVGQAVLSEERSRELEDKAREVVDRAQGPAAVALLVVLLCVLTPLAEEVLFRGVLFRSLRRLVALPAALVLAAAAFGVVHFAGGSGDVVLVQLVLLAGFGAVLCGLVQLTGRLGPGIVAHAAFNAATVASLLSSR